MYLDISNDGKCQCSLMALTGEVSKLSAPDIGSLTNSIDTVMHGENWRYDLTSRDKQFLAFWKLGIAATGAEYFQILAPSVDLANDKYQLRPSDDLEKLSIRANRGQRVLLGIMLSFYHSERGQRYLKTMRHPNLCDLSWSLDSFHREIAAGLFKHYAGW